jgi:hypothetical protein
MILASCNRLAKHAKVSGLQTRFSAMAIRNHGIYISPRKTTISYTQRPNIILYSTDTYLRLVFSHGMTYYYGEAVHYQLRFRCAELITTFFPQVAPFVSLEKEMGLPGT